MNSYVFDGIELCMNGESDDALKRAMLQFEQDYGMKVVYKSRS